MKKILSDFTKQQVEKINQTRGFKLPEFSVGDKVSVKYKITEGSNTRIQAFEGVVIAKTKSDSNYSASFTVRKISSNIGTERKFLSFSPLLAGVDVMRKGNVRRAKLYYLRNLTGKASRIKEMVNYTEQDQATTTEKPAAKTAKSA